MSDIPVPKVALNIMCDCGYDLVVDATASDPGDGITTFNFEGHCGNVVEVCHHQAWTASVTIAEVALQADAAARHQAQRERDRPVAAERRGGTAVAEEKAEPEDRAALRRPGGAGAHDHEPEPEPEPRKR